MYMNCAVVDIVPLGSKSHKHVNSRDVAQVNAAAQAALSSYPPLFLANLADVNDCITT